MTYPAISVANSILKIGREKGINDITPMKLQKLMYFSQFWYLKNYGEFLIDDNFTRWKFGPVIPSIYYELKHYNNNPIDGLIRRLQPNNDVVIFMINEDDFKAKNIIVQVLDVYGKYDGIQLSVLTHKANSSWQMNKQSTVITKEEMQTADL